MWCNRFKCTLFTSACIRRHTADVMKFKKEYREALRSCKRCVKGSKVLKNPNKYINRDCERIKNQYTIEKGVLKLNGKATKRKGINQFPEVQWNGTRDKQNVSTPFKPGITPERRHKLRRILDN